MECSQNSICIRGQLQSLPVFSHENHGHRFDRFVLEVARLSGTADLIPVIAPEELVDCLDPDGGDMIAVTGQIRSHNCRKEGKRKLLIFVFASSVTADCGESCNEVLLEGVLCREPVLRETPMGRKICDGMLAVPRAFHRADYLPCIFWGTVAEEIALCHTRDRISLKGRFQSREYQKMTESGRETRTAYEISALSAEVLPD